MDVIPALPDDPFSSVPPQFTAIIGIVPQDNCFSGKVLRIARFEQEARYNILHDFG